MRPDDIRAHLRKQPFEPFRVYLSDGSSYEVRHPELMLVTRTEVIIGLGGEDDELPESKVFCDPIHITRIKPIGGQRPRPKPRPRQ